MTRSARSTTVKRLVAAAISIAVISGPIITAATAGAESGAPSQQLRFIDNSRGNIVNSVRVTGPNQNGHVSSTCVATPKVVNDKANWWWSGHTTVDTFRSRNCTGRPATARLWFDVNPATYWRCLEAAPPYRDYNCGQPKPAPAPPPAPASRPLSWATTGCPSNNVEGTPCFNNPTYVVCKLTTNSTRTACVGWGRYPDTDPNGTILFALNTVQVYNDGTATVRYQLPSRSCDWYIARLVLPAAEAQAIRDQTAAANAQQAANYQRAKAWMDLYNWAFDMAGSAAAA